MLGAVILKGYLVLVNFSAPAPNFTCHYTLHHAR